jgi:hypothetical protein
MKKLKIGDTLAAYNDGKTARKAKVVVDDIIERKNLSLRARCMWKKALKQDFKDVFESCVFYIGKSITKQFWDWNCDVFICWHLAEPYGGDDDAVKPYSMLFAQRPKGFGWYCLNWNYDLEVGKRLVKSEA